jgi:fluoride exporter
MTSKTYNLSAIAAGGVIGTLLRYNLNVSQLFDYMPNATMFENMAGSFLLGCLAGWLYHRTLPEWLRLGLGVGLLGGFTTMSTLAADTFSIFNLISPANALGYLSLTLIGGLVMVFAGFATGSKLGSRKSFGEWEDNLD